MYSWGAVSEVGISKKLDENERASHSVAREGSAPVEARGPRRRRVGVNLEYGRSDRVWIPSTQGEDCGS